MAANGKRSVEPWEPWGHRRRLKGGVGQVEGQKLGGWGGNWWTVKVRKRCYWLRLCSGKESLESQVLSLTAYIE